MSYVKTESGAMVKVPSQGTVNTALGFGIAGTALNLMNNNNNGCGNGGLLGGLLGGNGNNNNGNCCVTEKEFLWAEKYNQCLANTARLEAENFTRAAATKAFEDSATYANRLDERQGAILEKLSNAVIALQTENATLKSDIRCLSVVNEKDHTILRDYTTSSVNLEAERRSSGDNNLACDFNAKLAWKANVKPYIDGQQVFCPDASICGGLLVAGGCGSCATAAKASKQG